MTASFLGVAAADQVDSLGPLGLARWSLIDSH